MAKITLAKKPLESTVMPAVPQPFSQKPVSEWILQSQQSPSAEERLLALQAIGLRATDEDVLHCAANALNDPDPTIRALAAKQLRQSSIAPTSASLSQLTNLLTDVDPDVRFESARALARHKAAHSGLLLPVCIAFLDEPETHPLMIASVLNAILEFDLSQASVQSDLLPRLLRFIEHERAEIREAVSIYFARWPEIGKSCVDQLLPLLDDSEPVVRENAANAIGQTGLKNDAILAALTLASNDEDPEVARVARNAIQQLVGN